MILNKLPIVDASVIEIPCQRNIREENTWIKEESGDDLWNDRPKKMLSRHRCPLGKKKETPFYGYKNHVKVDVKSNVGLTIYITGIYIWDSHTLELLLTEKDKAKPVHADSTYRDTKQEERNNIQTLND